MNIPFYHVDAFTTQRFTGNPAQVCILDKWLSDDELQAIASENHLPVTAYLVREAEGYQIRWFTPNYEVDLCGHGSLASSYVIFNILRPEIKSVTLKYSAGKLHVTNNDGLYVLQLPIRQIDVFHSSVLIDGLGVTPKEIYQYNAERCLAVFDTEEQVRQLNPDMSILKNLDQRGIIVTAASRQYDFISRTFYPYKPVCEDAVTGASHCLLVPYWASKLNKTTLHAYQASQRGGELFCELLSDKVAISGKAVLYAQGVINF